MRFNAKVEQVFENILCIVDSLGVGDRLGEFEKKKMTELRNTVIHSEAHLSEPLRVAVSGFMKAGKSTLMNSLLKEKIVFTGTLVATYIVTWFKYGEDKHIEIIFKDGTVEYREIADIENWTVIHKAKANPRIRDVEYIVVYYPNEILKSIELIDTPGLFSPEDDESGDSRNALRFLGLGAIEDANDINTVEASKADAIIYAFGNGFKDDDLRVVKAFSTSSVNAIGIFSKIDQSFWDCFTPEISPEKAVTPIIKRLSGELRDNMYRILPISALCVEGSVCMGAEEWETLNELAAVDRRTVTKMLSDAGNFATKEYDGIGITPARRKALLDIFGQYGIYLALRAIKEGVSREMLTDYMYRASGLEELRGVMLRHFGNRSYLIKTDVALSKIEAVLDKLRYNDGGSDRAVSDACETVKDMIAELREDNSFVELGCLRDYYSGKITFPPKTVKTGPNKDSPEMSMDELFLHIMGEYGRDCLSRLAKTEISSIEELKATVTYYISLWSPFTGFIYSKATNNAAKAVITRLREMFAHLDALCDDIENR